MLKKTLFLFLSIIFAIIGQAQRPLKEVEKELQPLAFQILNSDSFALKVDLNKKFTKELMETLKRPESFNYDFDSLKTISILRSEDNAFRVFTWYIVDRNSNEMYGEQYHYYFGLIQRNYVDPKTQKKEMVVIPLIETKQISTKLENIQLDEKNWLGGLYYPMKNRNTIPATKFKYRDRPKSSTERGAIKTKSFYTVLGWNGADNRSDYKFIDAISFDEKDKTKVLFGIDRFFFDKYIPQYRAIFKYSQYASFTMNTAKVKSGMSNRKQVKTGLFGTDMIVYDHLAVTPGASPMNEIMALGPDGSYDALFLNPYSKVYRWYSNVKVADRYEKGLSPSKAKEIEKRRVQAYKDLYGKNWKKYYKEEKLTKQLTPKEMAKKAAQEKKKQEAAGIKVNGNKK